MIVSQSPMIAEGTWGMMEYNLCRAVDTIRSRRVAGLGGKINASTAVKQMAGGDAHRLFTAAQNFSVTAALSAATFQPFVSASSRAILYSI
jgi:hypothetical protein